MITASTPATRPDLFTLDSVQHFAELLDHFLNALVRLLRAGGCGMINEGPWSCHEGNNFGGRRVLSHYDRKADILK
jgi:hypothetical protein